LGVAGWAFAGPTRAQTIDGPSALAQIYRRLPAISAVALSPDGQKLAIAANEADASGVRIFDLETRQIIARFTTG
jgi:WD40 repeat protein